MSKYVIEFDKEQLLEYDKDTDTYFRTLYKAKGFNALVFDKNGLDKLTPLDKELEEAYQKGKHDAEQDLARAAYEEAYQKGYEVGQHEATTLEYQQGLEEGKKQAKAQAHLDVCHDIERVAHGNYQQGLDDAWEFINKFGDFQYNDAPKVFGTSNIYKLARIMSCSEALEKFATYEQQKADAEIKVGDIITDGKINYLVIDITDKSYVALQGTDFEPAYIGKDYIKSYHNLHDSKDMRKIAEEINKAMKEGAE